MIDTIPFCIPTPSNIEALLDAVATNQISGNNKYGKKVVAELESYYGGESRVFLTPSGSSALEMGIILLDIKPGDEVIMPSYTFTSTANAVVLRGGVPVFVDVKEGSQDINEELVEQAITDKTKCILPIFYAGASTNIDKLEKIAAQYNLKLFTDGAQALGSTYNNKPIEKYGDMSILSFHQTKNISCGEGGALIVNNPEYFKRAEVVQEKGTNRAGFSRGEVGFYNWQDIGSSFLLSELCAAYLYPQIIDLKNITNTRLEQWNYYYQNLQDLNNHIKLPSINEKCAHNAHAFHVSLSSLEETDRLLEFFKRSKIIAPKHYYPLHLTEMCKKYSRIGSTMVITEQAGNTLIRLPLYHQLTKEQQDRVISALKTFFL